MRNLDRNATIQPTPARVELRGPSGRLYGYIDPRRMVIEVKNPRGGKSGHETEEIDLRQYLSKP